MRRLLQTAFPILGKRLLPRTAPASTSRTHIRLSNSAARSTSMSSTQADCEPKPVLLRSNTEYKQLFDHCYDSSSPICAGFSRDWDNWERADFFRVLDNWMDVTEAELILNKIYKLPKPVIPLAFLNAHECHLLFEAGSEYYYYDGADGHLYRCEGFADRDDFIKNFLVKGHTREIPWPDDGKAIGYETQWQQRDAKSAFVRRQRLVAKTAGKP